MNFVVRAHVAHIITAVSVKSIAEFAEISETWARVPSASAVIV